MELIRRARALRSRHRSCVATLGAFDGVHLGHEAVIRQLRREASKLGVPATVVTFEPLPREVLQPDEAPARLTTLREKFAAIAALGVDRMLCLRFDDELRSTGAEEFVESVFVRGLGVKALILGDDVHFGRGREGDAELVHRMGEDRGFRVLPMETVEVDGDRVSSTRVRGALAEADFFLAEKLLGRPFSISGRVVYGRALGRQLGSPTANIPLRRRVSPLAGVYAVTVSGDGLEDAAGVANVGARPTIGDGLRHNLEVHLLQGSPNLYGRQLTVRPQKRLRGEIRFESVEALRAQIELDKQEARDYFAALQNK